MFCLGFIVYDIYINALEQILCCTANKDPSYYTLHTGTLYTVYCIQGPLYCTTYRTLFTPVYSVHCMLYVVFTIASVSLNGQGIRGMYRGYFSIVVREVSESIELEFFYWTVQYMWCDDHVDTILSNTVSTLGTI